MVEIGFVLTLLLTINPNLFGKVEDTDIRLYNGIISFILFITVAFANFAESIAEGRGKAQADTLKKTRQHTKANLLRNGKIEVVDAGVLKKGDIVVVNTGELIPNDGTVIEGIASVDESAITGESAPVVKEAGGDFSSVTGGTRVVSDKITVEISVSAGESFLDKMINLVEGARKTENSK